MFHYKSRFINNFIISPRNNVDGGALLFLFPFCGEENKIKFWRGYPKSETQQFKFFLILYINIYIYKVVSKILFVFRINFHSLINRFKQVFYQSKYNPWISEHFRQRLNMLFMPVRSITKGFDAKKCVNADSILCLVRNVYWQEKRIQMFEKIIFDRWEIRRLWLMFQSLISQDSEHLQYYPEHYHPGNMCRCIVILATCAGALSWNKIMTKLEK